MAKVQFAYTTDTGSLAMDEGFIVGRNATQFVVSDEPKRMVNARRHELCNVRQATIRLEKLR